MRQPLTKEELQLHTCDYRLCNPSVYVGTYDKYNCGNLFGAWVGIISFDDYEDFVEFCLRLHHDEEDPELMFQDYECFPSSWYKESSLDEDTFDNIQEYYLMESDEQDAYGIYLNEIDSTASISEFKDAYQGKWDSEEDYAEETFISCYDCPDNILPYIDYRKFWRALEDDGYSFYDGYVFYN